MKKTVIALLILAIVSFISMVRYYFATIEIHNGYVNENTLVYLNSLGSYENLPQWTTMRDLWKNVEIDSLIRFIFTTAVLIVVLSVVYKSGRPSSFLSVTLGLSFFSFLFMFFYFAASNDIYNEYVNGEIIRLVHESKVGSMLPSASCGGEWGFTKIDLILRAIFMLFITVFMVKMIFKEDKQVVILK